MPLTDCTDTISGPAEPSLAAQVTARVWFTGRQFVWWFGRGCEAALASAERARQRRRLGELSDAMLHDLGLTRSDVDAETRKPFWRA
jgi:uncharacterized protein YjiS (DUF1127 family)